MSTQTGSASDVPNCIDLSQQPRCVIQVTPFHTHLVQQYEEATCIEPCSEGCGIDERDVEARGDECM